ncbi:MAG: ATP phosphoribosyltransferase [Phycisphaeraceae bacterium]|nr:MAG: ATP phosphoribosyltransferase [Phycisphaeraceae bacterium]
MPRTTDPGTIRLALPKGRMEAGVMALLAEAGVRVASTARGYRPAISLPGFEAKVLKPQNIIEMLAAGSRDLGFAGSDWVEELGLKDALVEVYDTGLDPVRLVAAAPAAIVRDGRLTKPSVVVASEFERLTTRWIADRRLDARFVRTFGATEVFPPEDADCIVDIAASGATLAANGLIVFDELARSTTRLYASAAAMRDPAKREAADQLAMLLKGAAEARRRVMIEFNVPSDRLENAVEALPCMREPTIATLHHGAGYAVKAAVPRDDLPRIIVSIKKRGGSDIVVTTLSQIVA